MTYRGFVVSYGTVPEPIAMKVKEALPDDLWETTEIVCECYGAEIGL